MPAGKIPNSYGGKLPRGIFAVLSFAVVKTH
jgi:hypothetical protein